MLRLQATTFAALLLAGGPLFADDVTRADFPADYQAPSGSLSAGEQASRPFTYDRSTRTLFVEGYAYYIPQSVNTIRLWDADKVALTWSRQGGRRVVETISVQREDDRPPRSGMPLVHRED